MLKKGKAMNLNNEEKQELQTLYTKLSTLYKEKAQLELFKKEREDKLKEEIASACKIVDKKGETQSAKVKMPLVKALLEEFYKDLPNKESLKADTMESYKLAIKNKEVSEDCIQAFLSSDESLKENASNIKEAYKESSLLSKEILEALNALVKDEFKLYLNEVLSEAGYEVKEIKDKSELLELKETIKALLG